MIKPQPTARSPGHLATVIAIGVLAATVATLCHETIGHGLSCVASGGHITLLTSIWFRCSEWNSMTSLGGPIGNLAAGLLAVLLLNRLRPGPHMRLFLLMSAALNLYWFMGQLAFDSLKNSDDWHFTALTMRWPPSWKMVGAFIGIGGYVLVSRVLLANLRERRSPSACAIALAYVAAAGSAVVAGLLWRPEPWGSAFEGFKTLGITPVAMLYIAWRAGRDVGSKTHEDPVPPSWHWIAGCALVFGVFLYAQATGVGSMAASGLP
ncbi:MAG: hypothetical protein WCD66_14185 [Rhodanobacteraceae bacterium]